MRETNNSVQLTIVTALHDIQVYCRDIYNNIDKDSIIYVDADKIKELAEYIHSLADRIYEDPSKQTSPLFIYQDIAFKFLKTYIGYGQPNFLFVYQVGASQTFFKNAKVPSCKLACANCYVSQSMLTSA